MKNHRISIPTMILIAICYAAMMYFCNPANACGYVIPEEPEPCMIYNERGDCLVDNPCFGGGAVHKDQVFEIGIYDGDISIADDDGLEYKPAPAVAADGADKKAKFWFVLCMVFSHVIIAILGFAFGAAN
jgi:hypothetical protein